MASVYILHSSSSDLYYVGYSKDLTLRIEYHENKEFHNSFTAKHEGWVLFYAIENLSAGTAVKIERHIKRMKSKIYIQNLKRFPDISRKLIQKYT